MILGIGYKSKLKLSAFVEICEQKKKKLTDFQIAFVPGKETKFKILLY